MRMRYTWAGTYSECELVDGHVLEHALRVSREALLKFVALVRVQSHELSLGTLSLCFNLTRLGDVSEKTNE